MTIILPVVVDVATAIVMPDLRDLEDGRYRLVLYILGQRIYHEQDKDGKNKGNYEHQDYTDCR